MRLKRIPIAFLAFLLVVPAVLTSAETSDSSTVQQQAEKEGTYSAKHEVVYATLNAAGDQQEMYVVNNFTIEEVGTITDFGPYTSIQNLTDLSMIQQQGEQVTFIAQDDPFYYQGNLDGKLLPWDIDIAYTLDGESISPEKLPGKAGELAIQIKTAANEQVDSTFFKNYLLQITLTLDSTLFKNVEAEDGTVAHAGTNRRVTFTVMPEKEESFTVKADVKDLEMEGIEVAAVPSAVSIDAPDAGAMKRDMKSLADATQEINRGVRELQRGISQLADGTSDLHGGSSQYQKGIKDLSNGSVELTQGSTSIKAALEEMSTSVSTNSGDIDLTEFKQLEEGLRQIASGLSETEKGLASLKEQYGTAYQALDQAMTSIPAYDISEADIQALYESGADPEVINKLTETYQAARTAKGTYELTKEAFTAVGPTLDSISGSLTEMSGSLTTLADHLGGSLEQITIDESMKQLQEGLQALSSQYSHFHSGLLEYTDGVGEIATAYQEIHNGIGGLANGTGQLKTGVSKLRDGTATLASSTRDLPEQVQREIDEMMSKYDKSDFDPVSFVSPENDKVESVQFIIKTESIKKDNQDEEAEEPKEEKSFWDRLLDLFR